MTLRQATKHKKVIRWWLDNTDLGVWEKCNEKDGWYLTHEPKFLLNCKYAINDEFAKFRKAEADGKQIQYRMIDHFERVGQYTDWTNTTMDEYDNSFQYDDVEFRIKPDICIKPGDWVYVKYSNGLKKIARCDEKLPNLDDAISLEKWIPKCGETCVFWDNDGHNEYFIAQYKSKSSDGTFNYDEETFDNVAPLEVTYEMIEKRDKQLKS